MDTLAPPGDSDQQAACERFTLAILLNHRESIGQALTLGLGMECFRPGPNRVVISAMMDLAAQGFPPTIAAVCAQLRTSGEMVKLRGVNEDVYVSNLALGPPSLDGLPIYISHLREQQNRLKVNMLLDEWRTRSRPISELIAQLSPLESAGSPYVHFPSADDEVREIWRTPAPPRIRTGIGPLDAKLLGGLMPESITTLCGATGRGKTGFVVQLVRNWLQDALPVLFIQTELDKRQTYARILAPYMPRPWSEVYGLGPEHTEGLRAIAARDLPGLRVWPWKRGQSVAAIVAGYIAKQSEKPLVVVDHVGDLARSLRQSDMRSATSTVFSELKEVALDQKVHILAVSHVARAVTADKDSKPIRSGRDYEGTAKDAGEVENDSSTILYLETEPPGADGTAGATIHLAKVRGAPPNQTVRMRFDGAVGCFSPALDSDLSADEQRVLDAIVELTGSGQTSTSIAKVKAAAAMGQVRLNVILAMLASLKRVHKDRTGIYLSPPEKQP